MTELVNSDGTVSVTTDATVSTDSVLTGDSGPQLYAGKFKSVEDLENGYKQSLPLYQKNQELEAELKKRTTIPDEYSVPADVTLRETQLRELKALAKNAGLNEEQFLHAARSINANVSQQMSAFEERKQSVGEEKINLLKGFVNKNFNGFSDEFRGNMLNQIIRDDKTMNDALNQRDKQLNSQVPGMSGTSRASKGSELYDAKKECNDLAAQALARPNDMQIREQFISKNREVGHYIEELKNR